MIATARYATGYPARFHVVPPWAVEVEIADGRRALPHRLGGRQRRHPAPALSGLGGRRPRPRAARGRAQPPGGRGHPRPLRRRLRSARRRADLDPRPTPRSSAAEQAAEPAGPVGGGAHQPTSASRRCCRAASLGGDPGQPQGRRRRWRCSSRPARGIAVLLGVPPFLVGLPSGGDPMTYANVNAIFDYHWRAGLRPKAQAVMAALSQWLLPRGTAIEVNRDAYVQPEPLRPRPDGRDPAPHRRHQRSTRSARPSASPSRRRWACPRRRCRREVLEEAPVE